MAPKQNPRMVLLDRMCVLVRATATHRVHPLMPGTFWLPSASPGFVNKWVLLRIAVSPSPPESFPTNSSPSGIAVGCALDL